MKTLVLALFSLPLLAFASPQQQTVMRLKPWWPVYCEKHDYPLVNQVSPVERVSETATKVTFGFRAVVGECDEGQFVSKPMSPAAVTMTETSKIILFKKVVPVISETQMISPEIAYIKVTFDKTSIFKKKDHASFYLSFYSFGYVPPHIGTDSWGRTVFYPSPSVRFLWKADVARVTAEQTEMRVLLN